MGALSREARGEAEALLVLLRLPGVGDATTLELCDRFGSASAALTGRRADFAAVAGGAAADARADEEVKREVRRGLDRAREIGASVRVRGLPGYPECFEALRDPPGVVFLRGREELLSRPAVAVVGRRASTSYGRRVAEELGAGLARAGVVTVSGLALGIDGAAHRGALAAGGETAAALGTGVDVPYPRAHGPIFERIGREGLLVSEFLPGETARAHHFPRRNRLIAAMSGAVVVVEAARRSGALITAGHALDLGRPVGAVPGSIYRTGSEGTNRLLRDGAHPVLSAADALDLLPFSCRPARDEDDAQTALLPAGPVDGPASRVWEALDGPSRSVDELVERTGLDARRILAALTLLEVDGQVRRDGGARYRRSGS